MNFNASPQIPRKTLFGREGETKFREDGESEHGPVVIIRVVAASGCENVDRL